MNSAVFYKVTFFKDFYLFTERERARARESTSRGGGGRQREKQAPS